MQKYLHVAVGAMVMVLGGCTGIQGVPSPDYFWSESKADEGKAKLSVQTLVDHIECEIISDPTYSQELIASGYVAQVTLTLKVDANIGITPSVDFIKPYAVSGTSLTWGIDANLNADGQRTYTTSFYLNVAEMLRERRDVPCHEKGVVSLSGDLGIGAIIAAGLATSMYDGALVPPPKPAAAADSTAQNPHPLELLRRSIGAPSIDDYVRAENIEPFKTTAAAIDATAKPSFGSTVAFTITGSGDAGPLWTVKHFKGPSGGSKGILNGGEVYTDTLVIAFAPCKTYAGTKDLAELDTREAALLKGHKSVSELSTTDQASVAALDHIRRVLESVDSAQAVVTTQTLTTNMILQNLGTLP